MLSSPPYLLDPPVDHLHAVHRQGLNGAPEEAGLLGGGLDQGHPRARRGELDGQPGKTSPRPDVGEMLRLTYGLEQEATQRVQDVLRSEEHTSELQSRQYLVCRLLLEKKKKHQRPQ